MKRILSMLLVLTMLSTFAVPVRAAESIIIPSPDELLGVERAPFDLEGTDIQGSCYTYSCSLTIEEVAIFTAEYQMLLEDAGFIYQNEEPDNSRNLVYCASFRKDQSESAELGVMFNDDIAAFEEEKACNWIILLYHPDTMILEEPVREEPKAEKPEDFISRIRRQIENGEI